MKLAIIAALAALAVSAETPRNAIGIHTLSWHSEKGYNNTNPGAYLRWNGAQVGIYKNSYSKKTVYLAYNQEYAVYHDMKLGWVAGLATGYPRWPVVPMAAATFSYGGWRAAYVPKLDSKTSPAHVVHFMYEVKF